MSCDVSVIIPNYNKSLFVEECIESVLCQKGVFWELIIIDDASTDSSLEVVTSVCKDDNRCTIVKLNNSKGGSYCRNVGLSKAKGDYVIFLDSDDILGPSCLSNRLAVMRGNPTLDFAVFPLQTFEKDTSEPGALWNPAVNNPLAKFLSHDLPWQTMQPIFKKSFVEKLGGYNPAYERMQDVEFHTRALLNSDRFALQSGSPDCYLRVSSERFTLNPNSYLRCFFSSAMRYNNEFGNGKTKSLLSKMLIEVMAVAQHYRLSGKIKTSELKELASETGFDVGVKSQIITHIYWFWVLFAPSHVPGVKWLTKRFIKPF